MLIGGVPLWVFIVILFIFFSGYMTFRTMQAEKVSEQQFLEQKGQVYIDRIRKEREEKTEQKA